MANTRSAKKNVRINEKRRQKNLARRTSLKTAIKKVHAALQNAPVDAATIQELLNDVSSKLSRAARKNVIHGRNAARRLSRLAKKVSHATRTTKA